MTRFGLGSTLPLALVLGLACAVPATIAQAQDSRDPANARNLNDPADQRNINDPASARNLNGSGDGRDPADARGLDDKASKRDVKGCDDEVRGGTALPRLRFRAHRVRRAQACLTRSCRTSGRRAEIRIREETTPHIYRRMAAQVRSMNWRTPAPPPCALR